MANQHPNGAAQKPECFVIMPIGDPEGYSKGHFQHVYEDVIVPACEMAGYKSTRADEVKQTNLIHLDVLQKLIDSPMAVCDLSSRNPNVLFELGLRQAFDKPVVLIQEIGTPKIFDIAPLRYCEYRKERVYHEVLEDQKTVAQAINATRDAKKESINSIVKLLSITKPATLPDVAETNKDPALQVIRAELGELRTEIRQLAASGARRPAESEFDFDRVRDLLRQTEYRIAKCDSREEAEALLIQAENQIRDLGIVSDKAGRDISELKMHYLALNRLRDSAGRLKRRLDTKPPEMAPDH